MRLLSTDADIAAATVAVLPAMEQVWALHAALPAKSKEME